MILMSRAGAKSLLDTTTLTERPARTAGWYMIGVSLAVFVNAYTLGNSGFDFYTWQLHKRVAENEHAHAILRNTKFHLDTRLMGIWDVNSQ